jgi:hypothetical protein
LNLYAAGDSVLPGDCWWVQLLVSGETARTLVGDKRSINGLAVMAAAIIGKADSPADDYPDDDNPADDNPADDYPADSPADTPAGTPDEPDYDYETLDRKGHIYLPPDYDSPAEPADDGGGPDTADEERDAAEEALGLDADDTGGPDLGELLAEERAIDAGERIAAAVLRGAAMDEIGAKVGDVLIAKLQEHVNAADLGEYLARAAVETLVKMAGQEVTENG